ncbi:hypothetical protein DYB28_004355, partial [Aphanomyces astaci]
MSSFPSQDPIMEPNTINQLRPSSFNWNTPSETSLPSMQSLDLSNPHAAAASSIHQQMPGMGQSLHIQTQFPQMQQMSMPYGTNANNPMSMGMVMNNHVGGMGQQQHNMAGQHHHQQSGLPLRSPMPLGGGSTDHLIPHLYQHHQQQHHQQHHLQSQGYASPMTQQHAYGAQDPMKLNSIMSTPAAAAAPPQSTLPSRITPVTTTSPGFPSTYEFEVVLQKGEHGLCMNMGIKMGSVSVLGFRQPLPGVVGPAEACGMIQVGDDLVCVDGIMLQCADDFKKVVPHLKSDLPAKLRFRRSPQPPQPPPPQQQQQSSQQQQQQQSVYQPLPAIPPLTGTGSSGKVYQIGELFMGVRYLGPNQWAAEVKTHQGDTQLQRLGEFTTDGSGIPTDLLRVAVRGAGGSLEFNTAPKERSRKKTFNDSAPKSKRMKYGGGRGGRGGRGSRGRGRGAVSDEEDDGEFKDGDDEGDDTVVGDKPEPKRYSEVAEIDGDEEKPKESSPQQQQAKGPQMDKIIAVRFVEPDMGMEFLMKWKHFSYLHVTWLSTLDIERHGKGAVMRMRRYMQ